MTFVKFITYYSGIIKVKYSRGFDAGEENIPRHAELIDNLRNQGIKSGQIISCGIAQVTKENRIYILENNFTGNVRIEDVVRDTIKRGKKSEDPTQQHLFEKER